MGVVAKNINLEERDWRYQRVRDAMAREDLGGLIVYSPAWRRENVRYLTGAALSSSVGVVYFPFSGSPTAFLMSPEDELAVRNGGFVENTREVRLHDMGAVADTASQDAGSSRIGIVGAEFVPVAVWEDLKKLLKGTELVNVSPLMDRVRLVKSDWEIEQLRFAGTICDAAWVAFVEACKPGACEFEIVAGVEASLRNRGGSDNFMLIASGGSDVRGMTPPGDRRLEVGDMVRTELTPQWNGYWTQICRTAVLGKPSAKQQESFDLFNESVAAGIDAIHAGVTAHEVAKAENDVFRKYGYGEYCTSEYTRVRGHCLGLHFDEVPILEDVHTVLEKNSVLIVHPNTFTPLAGYHVLGDPVVVTEHGAEKLISTPREFDVAAG